MPKNYSTLGRNKMAGKKAPAKKVSSRPRSANDVRGSGSYGITGAETKAGKDARRRASKYGTPTSPTTVSSMVEKKGRGGRPIDKKVFTKTEVKVRGGKLNVEEDKVQRWAARDSKPRTTVTGVVNKKSQAGDLGASRALARKKAAAKRNKK